MFKILGKYRFLKSCIGLYYSKLEQKVQRVTYSLFKNTICGIVYSCNIIYVLSAAAAPEYKY